MIKLIGAVLILASFLTGAALKVNGLKKELFTLRGMIRLTEMMKNEIVARRTRLVKLSDMLIPASDEYTKAFTQSLKNGLEQLGEKSFFEIWRGCVDTELRALAPDCREALISLGSSIGRYDAQLQQSAFERCTESLCESENRISRSYINDRKMYFGTFAGAGIVAVIVLI